jgi:hypothetical protein
MKQQLQYPYHEAAAHWMVSGWVCKNCGRFFGDKPESERLARFCCTHQALCLATGCGQLTEPNYTMCQPHLNLAQAFREKERFDKAEHIPMDQWDGPVFLKGFGSEFFETVGEFVDEWEGERGGYDEDDKEILTTVAPAYVYAAKAEPMVECAADSLFEQVSENAYDEWDGRLNGVKELEAAVERFNLANASLKVWHPDYSRAILLTRVDNPTPVCDK